MIDTSVQVGQSRAFQLTHAILVYTDRNTTFATIHEPIAAPDGGAPLLGPGEPLTRRFLTHVSKKLKKHIAPEILPENVLCRTEDRIIWWSPARTRTMYYTDQRTGVDYSLLHGKAFPQPALMWKIRGRQISVRALAESQRPHAETLMKVAPYWNVYENGSVCQGSMRHPDITTITNLDAWEEGFWSSYFTHPNCQSTYIDFEGGFFPFWHSLIDREVFPVQHLIDAKQTLAQFVGD